MVASRGLGISDTALTAFVSDELAYRLARSLESKDAEAIFISCTNFPTIAILGRLERDTGLPVVTSNQAMAWACFERLGVSSHAGERYGRLMTMSSPQRAIAPTLDVRSALEPVEA